MIDRIDPQPWMTAPATRAVMAALEAAGGEGCARFVGGSVRDALIGRVVVDIDIATQLTPQQTKAAIEAAGLRAVPTGIEHGTVTAISERRPFEITTLRRDVETDGRRAVVAFTRDWSEDAARRDFRLNALYADAQGRLYDPVGGGVEDALAGRIVFVGDAGTRIREDYLRILRFFRFTAWYGRGDPDAVALGACAALKSGVASLSAERISKELLKLLAAPDPREAVRLMDEAGVLALILPEPLDRARFERVAVRSDDPALRLSALLPDEADLILGAAVRLRLSNTLRDRLVAACGREARPDLDPPAARALLYRIGAEAFLDQLQKQSAGEADLIGLAKLAQAWTKPRFPVNGADVMATGTARGPEVGRRLAELEADWIASDFTEDRLTLLRRLATP